MSARLDVYVDEFSKILTRVRVWKQYDITNRCSGFFKLGVISIACNHSLTRGLVGPLSLSRVPRESNLSFGGVEDCFAPLAMTSLTPQLRKAWICHCEAVRSWQSPKLRQIASLRSQ